METYPQLMEAARRPMEKTGQLMNKKPSIFNNLQLYHRCAHQFPRGYPARFSTNAPRAQKNRPPGRAPEPPAAPPSWTGLGRAPLTLEGCGERAGRTGEPCAPWVDQAGLRPARGGCGWEGGLCGAAKQFQRTGHSRRPVRRDVRIDLRGAHVGVTEELLDRPDVRPTLQKVRRE